MTTERDTRENLTADQFGKELLEFVQDTEFGTPQYQAICDYFDLEQLRTMHEIQILELQSTTAQQPDIRTASKLRVTELKVAHFEHEINQNRSRFKGYESAFEKMEDGIDNLSGMAAGEAAERYEDETKQDAYMRRIRNNFYAEAKQLISAKRE